MKYGTAPAFRRALEDRLKVRAGGDGARIARDRKRVVFDRFLARLVQVAAGEWVLKGGFALDLRLEDRARSTQDIDLAWHADDVVGAEILTTPDLLGFAGIAPVAVPAIPIVMQVAEKLHAYTRVYEGERVSSRAKNFVDLALIAQLIALDADELRRAIETTFAARGTHEPPRAVPPPPQQWRAPFGQLAQAVGLDGDLDTGHHVVATMFDSILDHHGQAGTWNPDTQHWTDIVTP